MKIKSLIKHNLMRAAMTLALILACATAWADNVSTYYIDENGTRHDVTATVLTGTGTLTANQWYVVNSDVTISNSSGQIYSYGNINLILADGMTFTISSDYTDGIISTYHTLSIYGQENGTGTLNVTANGSSGNAIYGDSGVNIVGCRITATSTGGTGIQSAYNITISGGQVSATGGSGYYGLRSFGTITLGWRKTTDYVYASSYNESGTVKVKDGQAFKDNSGNIYVGTLDKNQIKGKTLIPATQTEYIQCCLGMGNNGSAEHPYTISDANGWNAFCLALDDTNTWNGFSGKTVKLGANISITQSAGSAGHEFMGIFDGDGKTLTVNITETTTHGTAPFREINGATIQNLVVTGSVEGTIHAAGLVGFVRGADATTVNTITNCKVATNVTVTTPGGNNNNNYHCGGVVGHAFHCTLNMSNTVYCGDITNSGNNYVGGLQGWSDGNTINFSHCLFVGSYSGTASFHPVAVRNNNSTTTASVSHVYYTVTPTLTNSSFIAADGTKTISRATAPATIGDQTQSLNFMSSTLYQNGICYNNLYYATIGLPSGGTDIYLINNADDWLYFCDMLYDNATWDRFSGKTVKLDANISVTQSAGSPNHDFCGTFDGQNNTLTFTATATDNYLAPFRYVSGTGEPNHAVIQNLDFVTNITATDFRHAAGLIADMSGYVDVTNCNVTANITANKGTNQTQLYPAGLVSQVAGSSQLIVSGCTVSGTISTDGKYAAGMVGIVQSSASITNSVSSVTINSSTDGDGTHGGFVASLVSGRQLIIEGCVFNGKIVTTNGTTNCGGFLGHNNTNGGTGATITNCLYAPTADLNTMSTGCATFGRNVNSDLISNCYYTTALGDAQDAQGTQAYSITADDYVTTLANAGTVSNNYTASGLIFYNVGLKYGDVLYAASNDEVSLTLAHQDREGYDFIGYTATAGNLNGSTLTMPDGNVTINAEYTCTAPSELLTVYDGTTTQNTVPAYIFFFDDFTRSQFVIPANDLVEMVGASITSMTFYTTSGNVPYTTESPADVYLMEVNYTSISAYEPKSSATTVYSGLFEIVSTDNGGEMTINFSTPFAYQGGNLLVGIENTVNVNEGYKNINFYGQTVTGASISGYNSTSLDNVEPTQRNFIPKTTFGFTPACEPKSLPYAYGFEDPDEFDCWTMLDCHDGSTLSNRSAYQGEYGFGFHWNETPPQYLISPKFEGTTGMQVSFFYKNDSEDWPETFQVGYSTTTKSPNAFVWGEEVLANDHYTWQLYEEFFPEGTKYVAVKLNSNDALYLYLDNFNFEPAFCADEDKCELTFTLTDSYGDGWNDNAIRVVDVESGSILATLANEDLDSGSGVETQTITLPVCDGRELRFEWVSGQWPDECSYTVTDNNGIVVFTGSNVMSEAVNYTIDCSQRFVFLTDGDWNDGSNWSIGVVPEEGSDVIIQADVVIPAGYTAYASDVALEGGSITVGDGGQLIHSNEGVHAMVEKHIEGFGTNDNKGGYYLLTNPVADVQQPSALGLLENNYDLYRFDQAQDLEWQNYKHNSFDLANGMGYLYANSADTDIAFSGVLNPANVDVSVTLAYDANAEFAGWNLVGNPFVCNAYLADGRDFFILDDDGKEVILSNITNSIAPMQGVFVQAAANESSVSFTTTASAKGRALNLSVTRNRGTVIDNARVRFDEGRSLEKFQLNPNHTKLYIPQDGKDYAVVNTEAQGELPFSFKAEESGIYTISVNFENVDVDYLHLIDNMTGVDIDLLQTPSYTFEAKTTDYESRFKLVFSANNNDNDIEDENFAFISDGNLIINGTGTLQVFDILGHQLLTQSIYSAFRIPHSAFPTGVYVLRLVNGSDVKTQKMVIE